MGNIQSYSIYSYLQPNLNIFTQNTNMNTNKQILLDFLTKVREKHYHRFSGISHTTCDVCMKNSGEGYYIIDKFQIYESYIHGVLEHSIEIDTELLQYIQTYQHSSEISMKKNNNNTMKLLTF